MQLITRDAAPPTLPPERSGQFFIDTSAKRFYFSVGTDSVNDWWLVPDGLTGNFIGTGSPETVITASPGARYFDSAAQANYVKVTGTNTNTGWL